MEERILQLENNLEELYNLFNKMNNAQSEHKQHIGNALIETRKMMIDNLENFSTINENFKSIESRLDVLENES